MRLHHFIAIAKFAACVAFLLAMLTGLDFLAPQPAFAKDEPKWIEVHTAHFSVLTDAGEKRGREVALRMEQMRAVFGQLLLRDKLRMPVPITVIALKSDKQYGMVAPGKQSTAGGVFCAGVERDFYIPEDFLRHPFGVDAAPFVA